MNVNEQLPMEFDPVKAELAREEGIARVDRAAQEIWKGQAFSAVHAAATRHQRFIVDTVWAYMPESTRTHDLRAMGPVIRRAVKEGWIVATADYRLSSRISAHKNPRKIWRSLIYQSEQ